MIKNVVLYHHGCPDGICSAWVVWNLATPKELKEMTFISVKHHQPPPQLPKDLNTIFILDFCYSPQQILKLKEDCQRIILLDHHLSSKRMMNEMMNNNFSWLSAVFDMERSGCQITWDYIYSNRKRPWFLDYIADRDLWTFKLPYSKEINKWLWIKGCYNFNVLEKLYQTQPNDFTNSQLFYTIVESGMYYLEMEMKMIKSISSKKVCKTFQGYNVALINSSVLISEVGNYLAEKKYNDEFLYHFVMIYYYDMSDGMFHISLRGHSQSPDLSLIASQMGGGGHPQAAGFITKDIKELLKSNK